MLLTVKMEAMIRFASEAQTKSDDPSAELAEIDRQTEDEFTTWHVIDSFCKRCPNCQTPIQKSDGCNKMACSRCRMSPSYPSPLAHSHQIIQL